MGFEGHTHIPNLSSYMFALVFFPSNILKAVEFTLGIGVVRHYAFQEPHCHVNNKIKVSFFYRVLLPRKLISKCCHAVLGSLFLLNLPS